MFSLLKLTMHTARVRTETRSKKTKKRKDVEFHILVTKINTASWNSIVGLFCYGLNLPGLNKTLKQKN